MKKLAGILFCLITLCGLPVRAQDTAPQTQSPPSTPTPAPRPAALAYNVRTPAKLEISAGYTYRNYSPDPKTSFAMNGAYISVDYNIFTWLGAAGEGVAVGRISGAQNLGTAQRWGIITGMGGPQFYPMRHRKFTPFGHVLVGNGYYVLTAPAFAGFPSKTTTSTGFSYEVGGGFDLRIKRHWSIRLAEGDWGETSFFGGNPHQESYRISAGVVYLRGEK